MGSEKSTSEFLVTAQCTQEKVLQADLSITEWTFFESCEVERSSRAFAVGISIKSDGTRIKMARRSVQREISYGAEPEANSLSSGVRCAKLITKTLSHGMLVLAAISGRVNLQQNSIEIF